MLGRKTQWVDRSIRTNRRAFLQPNLLCLLSILAYGLFAVEAFLKALIKDKEVALKTVAGT